MNDWNNLIESQCCSINLIFSNEAKLFKAAAFFPDGVKTQTSCSCDVEPRPSMQVRFHQGSVTRVLKQDR